MSFDELVLDDAEQLALRDDGRLLWALAGTGAQVRRYVELRDESGLGRLAGGDEPRAVLVASDVQATGAARALARVVTAQAPAVVWRGVDLPRWAGPADALLVGSTDGRHPRLVRLVEEATYRGLALVVVAPVPSPVAQAAGRSPVVGMAPDVHPRAARWAVLAPLLQAADVLGLIAAPADVLAQVAAALDETAELCRPNADAFTNPAKVLALELSDSLPVVAGAGPLAGVAARAIAEGLQLLAGSPAVSVGLPDGVATAGALLRGAAAPVGADDPEGLFADRGMDAARRPCLVTVGDDGSPDDPSLGERTDAQVQLDEVAGRRAAAALHGIAGQRGLRSTRVDVGSATAPLARFAAATQFGDFTATYLALGLGIDPSELRPGEIL